MRRFASIALVIVLIPLLGCGEEELPNNPPVINLFRASSTGVAAGSDVTLIVLATDPDGDDLTYTYQASAGTIKEIGDTVIFSWVSGANGHNVEQVNDSKKTSYESGFTSGDPQNGPAQWTLPDSYVQDNITLYYICGPHVISHNMRGKIIVGTGSENLDDGGANVGVILGIFIGTGVLAFAGIVLLQKRK